MYYRQNVTGAYLPVTFFSLYLFCDQKVSFYKKNYLGQLNHPLTNEYFNIIALKLLNYHIKWYNN